MGILQKLIGAFLRPRAKRRARGRSLADLADLLEASWEPIERRLNDARDTPANREAINHLVGIERWGQARIRVALGEPFDPNGHRGYRLPDEATLDELRRALRETRKDTIALARELDRRGVEASTTVRHDDLGPLTPGEWLGYLEDHGTRERFRIRTG